MNNHVQCNENLEFKDFQTNKTKLKMFNNCQRRTNEKLNSTKCERYFRKNLIDQKGKDMKTTTKSVSKGNVVL